MVNLPVIDMVRTGQNIARLRKQAGLSVRDLQDIFGFATPQAIYKWQQGAALPTIDNLVVLAAVLQVRLEDILVTDIAAQVQISA
ncbi:MAG: helix-turn-helix transcriptional regulator [Lachnospiraceae bacterium]|jgi:transcriptional regulator with XRE-family HTH domain|nr:helix-turn-helix transcriptional regulator [Lachnospiraceae bacterium]